MTTEDEVRAASGREYWRLRYDRHKEKTPGTSNRKMHQQEQEYAHKRSFLINKIPDHEFCLDYGCGTGRHCNLFNPMKYLGVDIIPEALRLARKNNPMYGFSLLTDGQSFQTDMLFFSTVMQHMTDIEIKQALERIDFNQLLIFENTSNNKNKNYIYFRSDLEYNELIQMPIKSIHYFNNITWNNSGRETVERHSLIHYVR